MLAWAWGIWPAPQGSYSRATTHATISSVFFLRGASWGGLIVAYCRQQRQYKKNHEKFGMNDEGTKNHLDERTVYFVAYSPEEYNERNQGDHEGSIVLADMNIQDDTDCLHASKKIYATAGLSDFVPSSLDDFIDWKEVRDELYELEQKGKHEYDDDSFLDIIEYEDDPSPADLARQTFLLIQKGNSEEEDCDVVNTYLEAASAKPGKSSKEFLDAFLSHCGREQPLKIMARAKENVDKWLAANQFDRLLSQRSTNQLQKWHKKRFPGNQKPPEIKKKIVEDILGLEFPTVPPKPKKAKQLYRDENFQRARKGNPNATRKDINQNLNEEFDQLCDDESRFWDEEEQRDKERYDEEMLSFKEGNPDDEVFYMRRFDMLCACNPCLNNDLDGCLAPYKKYMKPKIVRMKVKQKEQKAVESELNSDGE